MPPSPITVTIAQDWDVTKVGKPIPAPYTTQVANGTFLVDIMNKAADENTQGSFNKYISIYYGGLGHFITAMNGTMQVCLFGYRFKFVFRYRKAYGWCMVLDFLTSDEA